MDLDVVIFEDDVKTITFPNTINIDSDLEMKSESKTKIRIECPVSREKLFDIM